MTEPLDSTVDRYVIPRRERIASAVASGLALVGDPEILARKAVAVADALIAELDK
jgi:hypothetical protein